MFNGSPETKRKEGDAGEAEPAATERGTPLRELRSGPQPGWRQLGEEAVRAAQEREESLDDALKETFGGDTDRDIPKNIILTDN